MTNTDHANENGIANSMQQSIDDKSFTQILASTLA
jgi:hypothetical protein